MANEYCKKLLTTWDLECLVDRFQVGALISTLTQSKIQLSKWELSCSNQIFSWQPVFRFFVENGINESNMPNLTADLIKELIPQIGLRITFSLKWFEHFSKERKEVQNLQKTTDNPETSSLGSDGSSENKTDDSIETILCTKIRRPHVRQMLKQSMQGRAILKSYTKTKTLSRKCRKLIVGIIISEILQENYNRRSFRNEDFAVIANEIVEVFPESEVAGTYYIPPIKKKFSRSQKSITSRGKLMDKYRNKIRKYVKLTGQSFSSESSPSTSVDQSSGDERIQADIETQNSIKWLEKNQAPWELVISHWAVTYQYRRKKIEQSGWNSVSDIITQWPILLHPQGYDLVSRDFQLLKLSETVVTLANWQNFFGTIHDLSNVTTDKKTNDLYDLLKSDELNEDSKVAVQLSLLPHLVPPKGRVRTRAKHWKPTIAECIESLIEHAKVPGDVSRIQERKVQAMCVMKLTVQPYIIVVGPTIKEISAFYVCIDQTLYAISSMLEAIDICFKTFHVFNATYPPQSEHIWSLMQHGLYRFTTKFDKQIAYIMEIISILQNKATTAIAE